MAVDKGTSDLTRFHKGDDQITRIHHGDNLLYINETTITIFFTDNTGSNATLNDGSSIVLTGTPGDSFPQQLRSVSAIGGRVLNSVTCSESGDGGNNVTCTTSGGTIIINGTFPSGSTSVTLSISATTSVQLPQVTLNFTGNSITANVACNWSATSGLTLVGNTQNTTSVGVQFTEAGTVPCGTVIGGTATAVPTGTTHRSNTILVQDTETMVFFGSLSISGLVGITPTTMQTIIFGCTTPEPSDSVSVTANAPNAENGGDALLTGSPVRVYYRSSSDGGVTYPINTSRTVNANFASVQLNIDGVFNGTLEVQTSPF